MRLIKIGPSKLEGRVVDKSRNAMGGPDPGPSRRRQMYPMRATT